MRFEGHEGLRDSPVAGSQTGWHPKSSFFILETAVVSVTTQPTNGALWRIERGKRAGPGCDGLQQCLELASWPGTVNTIPSTASPSVRPSWPHTHTDTSYTPSTAFGLPTSAILWTAHDVSLYRLTAC